jgi:transcriptional regulator of PTS gene
MSVTKSDSRSSTSGKIPLLVELLKDFDSEKLHSPYDQHRIRIFHAICTNPGITRKDLIRQLEIRPGTVSTITQKMIADFLVLEAPMSSQGARGRPEIPLYPNWLRWVAVSVFCVSMELHAVLINGADEILAESTIEIPNTADNLEIESSMTELVSSILSTVDRDSEVLAVALSIPGLVNSATNEWIFSARWPKLRHLSLVKMQQNLQVDLVVKRQLDVQLEYAMLRDRRLRRGNVLLFHWGYGIGGSFARNGSVVTSHSGVFCQIGHVSVYPDSTKPCICGRIGCLEADAALWALAPEMARVHGPAPPNELELVEFLSTHSVSTTAYFRHARKSVAHALSHLLAVLVPDRALMYGPFLQNREVFSSLTEEVRNLSPPFVAESTVFEAVTAMSWDAPGSTVAIFRNIYQSRLVSTL